VCVNYPFKWLVIESDQTVEESFLIDILQIDLGLMSGYCYAADL